MALKDVLQQLASETNEPCITISLNTHRTHPANLADEIVLKNLVKEAEEKVIEKYGKRSVSDLLDNLKSVSEELDVNYNLDSLHLFLSNDTKEVVRSPWSTSHSGVHIANHFVIRPVIKAYNRSEEYLVMVIDTHGIHMYEALNDVILNEVKNADFPYHENTHILTHSDKRADPKQVNDMMHDYLNRLDKAVGRLHNDTNLNCVVISSDETYHKLLEAADKPNIYLGHEALNHNHMTNHDIGLQAYSVLKVSQENRRIAAITEIKEAVGNGKVISDLQEIYQAALDGRGDLLMVHQDFEQAVVMTGDRTFTIADNTDVPGAIDDITSLIAWEVMSKKGRVIFTGNPDIKSLGNIVLKTRW
ncbi:MAG: hypothetical protein R2774_05095 [Saprospiraceae bacterium]